MLDSLVDLAYTGILIHYMASSAGNSLHPEIIIGASAAMIHDLACIHSLLRSADKLAGSDLQPNMQCSDLLAQTSGACREQT